MSESDPLVSLRHMRMAGVCANGGREWFRRHELSWEQFVREGLPASTIEATGDGIALRVTAEARREAAEPVAEPLTEPLTEVTSAPAPPTEAEADMIARAVRAVAQARKDAARGG